MRWHLLWLLFCLSGCALIPSNESKSANAKTAGNMRMEQETTARAVFNEARHILSSRTNGNAVVDVKTTSVTHTSDSEKWDYSYVRSLPFLLTVGVGLLFIGLGGFLCLRLYQSARQSSAAFNSLSTLSENVISNVAGTINGLLAVSSEPREQALLSNIAAELQKARGKVTSVKP